MLLAVTCDLPGILQFAYALEDSWRYLRSWHLQILGFSPEYHKSHGTGKSVLDRSKVYPRLRSRAESLLSHLIGQRAMMNVRFGHLIRTDDSTGLWLIFQTDSGSQEMNAILLPLRHAIDSEMMIENFLNLISNKPLWGKTDLALLSYSAKVRESKGAPIVVAEQRGITGVWWLDERKRHWMPIGRLSFSTRKRESVTLLRTILLSEEEGLRPVRVNDLRRPYHDTEGLSWKALLTISKAFENCQPVQCRLSFEAEGEFYSLTFEDERGPITDVTGELHQIIVRKTADLLELLRRPDFQCEPIIVGEKKLVWSRFQDIEYEEDMRFLRPWVERKNPVGRLNFGPPPTSEYLNSMKRGGKMEIELYHDSTTCPLKQVSIEKIREIRQEANEDREQYTQSLEMPPGQPDRFANRTGIHHGSCWALRIRSLESVPQVFDELARVRMKDSHAVSILRIRELVENSSEESKYVSHDFSVCIPEPVPQEFLESWHVRSFVAEITNKARRPLIPGSYLEEEGEWHPFIIIEPKHVTIGFKHSIVGEERAIVIDDKGVASKPEEDVVEFLETRIMDLMNQYGMAADRRLRMKISAEIDSATEIAGVKPSGLKVLFDAAQAKEDEFGGKRVYITMVREDSAEEYTFSVTEWLHNLVEIDRRIHAETIVDNIKYALDELIVEQVEIDKAMKDVFRILRREGFRISHS
jgi:hypothetical protein